MYGINPVGPPVAAFVIYFPALAVAEFDGSSSLGETACQDEWQVFVASGDDHARGKYTKGKNWEVAHKHMDPNKFAL